MAYEHSDHIGDAGFAPGAHVRLSRPPAVERRDVGVGDVADEREVARLHAVAEDPRRAAVQQPVARDRDDARLAGPVLAGPVDVAVAQGERRNAVAFAEGREVDLLRPLGRPVGRQRRRACRLGRRELLRIAVHRAARRGAYQPLRARLDRRVVQRDRALEAPARVTGGVARCDLDAALGREVQHGAGLEARQRLGGLLRAAVGRQRLRGRRLRRWMRLVVDDEHVDACGQQAVDRVRADESRPAGDRDALGRQRHQVGTY